MRAVSSERSPQWKRVLRRGTGYTSPLTTSPGLPATPVLGVLGTPWELQEVSTLSKMKSKQGIRHQTFDSFISICNVTFRHAAWDAVSKKFVGHFSEYPFGFKYWSGKTNDAKIRE